MVNGEWWMDVFVNAVNLGGQRVGKDGRTLDLFCEGDERRLLFPHSCINGLHIFPVVCLFKMTLLCTV